SLDAMETGLAVELSSALSDSQREQVLDEVRNGEVRFLFLAPEQLQNDDTLAALRAARPKLVVIDEAHCISEWGHDFRPDYLHLGAKVADLGHPTLLALTATAAPRAQAEIVERLGMEQPKLVVQDFDRPNIHLAVRHFRDDAEKLAALLEDVGESERPGIVYAARRRDTEEIAEALRERGIAASAYHAGL